MKLAAYITARNITGEEIKLQLQVERTVFKTACVFRFTIVESPVLCVFHYPDDNTNGVVTNGSLYIPARSVIELYPDGFAIYIYRMIDEKTAENRFYIDYAELLANLGMRTFFDNINPLKQA